MIWYGIRHWRSVKPWMNAHFAARREFLEWVWRKSMELYASSYAKSQSAKEKDAANVPTADNRIFADGIRLLNAECGRGMGDLLKMWRYYVKYRHVIFYTHEKDPVGLVRALLHPFKQVYNYSYLVGKK